jgi:cytidylate kinase
MNLPANLSRYTQALERAQQHWQERRRQAAAETVPALTIALTREAGAPGTSVAQEVGRRLGWPVYDREIVEIIAHELGLRVNLVESIAERRQTWLSEAFQAFAEVPTVTENTYVRHLIETVLALGKHGHCVLVGRGGALILPADTTLRVRLVAPHEQRVLLTARRLGISAADATRWVDAKDRERTRYMREHFLRDPSDPHLYDLLVNTSRWSVTEAADLIVVAVRRLEVKAAAGPQAVGP